MNTLNFILNMFWWFLEIKEIIVNIQIIKNGIEFINNIENVMMGNYYIMENMKKDNNLKLRGNENFKFLINNYILKEYNLLSFTNASYVNENEMILWSRVISINIENLLIGLQKFVYEYVNYLKYLFNWYSDFKILVDKSILISNIREELYYNISLELISEIQNEHNKALWWSIKELKKNILIQIFKNYFKVFKANPYKITIELINLHKKYSKTNILSYGIEYDVNVLTHNKYILSNLETDILSIKNSFKHSDQIIKNIDKSQFLVSKNNLIFKGTFKMNQKLYKKLCISGYYNGYEIQYKDKIYRYGHTLLQRTFTKMRLRWLNSNYLNLNYNYFNLDFLKNSIIWSNKKSNLNTWYIPKPIFYVKKIKDLKHWTFNSFILNEKYISIKYMGWGNHVLHKPDILIKWYLQWIPRIFMGVTDKETITPVEISEFIMGKKENLKIKNLKDLRADLASKPRFLMEHYFRNTKRGIINMYRLRKAYGGYSYWWAWFQDATYLPTTEEISVSSLPAWYFDYQDGVHGNKSMEENEKLILKKIIKAARNKKEIRKLKFRKLFIIGTKPLYYKPGYFFSDVEVNYDYLDQYSLKAGEYALHKAILDPRMDYDEVDQKMGEIDSMKEFAEKRGVEKKKLEAERVEAKRLEDLENEGIMEDTSIAQLLKEQERLHFKGIDWSKYKDGFKEYERKTQREKLNELRRQRDPLRISNTKALQTTLEEKYLTETLNWGYKKVRAKKGYVIEYTKVKGRALNDDGKFLTKLVRKVVRSLEAKAKAKAAKIGKIDKIDKTDKTDKITKIPKPHKLIKPKKIKIHWKEGIKKGHRKKIIQVHGNIGLYLTKKFFKTFLVGNDIWIKMAMLKKEKLLHMKKIIYTIEKAGVKINRKMWQRSDIQLSKKYTKFVSIDNLGKYHKDYVFYMKSIYTLYTRNRADLLMALNLLTEHKKFYELYQYIKKKDIWNKRWVTETGAYTPSWVLDKKPKLNFLKKITDLKLNDNSEELITLRVKYNTPLKYRPQPFKTFTIEKLGTEKRKYYILKNLFLYYFYPEGFKKLQKVRSNKINLIFGLNLNKISWDWELDQKVNYKDKFDYNLSMKSNLYKAVIRRSFRDKFLQTKAISYLSKQNIRGFLMSDFTFNSIVNSKYLGTMDYLRKVSTINWSKFYYINIESITEPLNLNIINQEFYGKNLNKEGFNAFLHKRTSLVTNIELPRKNNILLKKTYIKNLINVYEEEDNSVKNYIYIILIKEEFKEIYKYIWYIIVDWYDGVSNNFRDGYEMTKEFFIFFWELITEESVKRIREVRILKKFIEEHPEIKIYIIISIIFFIYVTISILLILIIKTFLPKNLIYGIGYKKEDQKNKETLKDNLDLLHNFNKVEDYKIQQAEDIIKIICELENMMDIDINKKKREKLHKYIKRRLKDIAITNNIELNKVDIDREHLKKLELYIKLKKNEKLRLKKNFFDAEHKYVYSWENKNYTLLDYLREMKAKNKNSKKIINFENKRFIKKRIYINKQEKDKINDLNKKYTIFYKKFFFEKNLEKWENNTIRRLDFLFNKTTKGIVRSVLTDIWRAFLDRKLNHNRMLFWDDPDLDDTSKITYMFEVYKPFFNIFFLIRFTIGSIKLWDITYWVSKWKQYVMYGVHAKVSYKDLRNRLEKEWSIEWYKDEVDYGKIQFKDFVKIIRKYKDIKKSPFLNKKSTDKKTLKKIIIGKIIDLDTETSKLKQIREYISFLKQRETDRIDGNFNSRFKDIAKKLLLSVDEVGPKKWAEQELRFKYRKKVYEQKLKIETEEYEVLKKSYTSRVSRDIDDKHKSLETLQWRDAKKVDVIMKQKIAAINYEKSLREYNYNNKFIDLALDAKEKVFYESIKEYNEDLSDAYLKIREEEKKELIEETLFERKSRKLYNILDQNYIWFRWFTTMGSRFNYIFVLIVSIFVGFIDNVKRIRRNEENIKSLLKIMGTDFAKYIYKIYWEYLIIWNRSKTLEKLGNSIIEILKFSIIFTPIFFYSTFLYSIFLLFILLIIIFIIFPKIIYKKIIKKKIIKHILNIINFLHEYLLYIWKIINLLFRNMETGETIWIQIYNKFYKICAKVQYNIYMFKGAFILGYTNNNKNSIKEGIISMKKLLKLKYNVYIEEWKEKRKTFSWKTFSWKCFFQKILIKNNKLKDNLLLKISLLKIFIPIKPYFSRIRFKIWYFFYLKIGKGLLKVDYPEFVKIYNQNFDLLKKYYLHIINFFKLSMDSAKKMKFKDFIILIIKTIIKTIWNLLILPFKFIIHHQKWKYIKNYKKGIQGFRDNSMYKIIDNPKPRKKDKWKIKLHNILMEKEISDYLKQLLYSTNLLIDVFFMYKIFEVKWTNKNYFQDFFWRKSYWVYKRAKETVLTYLIDIFVKIEENYATFEENIETKNWTLWERLKYAYHTHKLYKHGTTRTIQRRKSRDLFFYKKIKEKKKIMRIYLFKGLLNWLTYISMNKIIFTKVYGLKKKKYIYKYMKSKYRLTDIEIKTYTDRNIHITESLNNTPPQLWSLIIMYEMYYKGLLRYRYENDKYPIKWEDNKSLELQKEYKWRLAAPRHTFDIPFYDRRFIAADLNNYDFIEFIGTLASEPYDPLLRWIIFLLEYGLATEDIILAGNNFWNTTDSISDYTFIWADISLTQLLTYNKEVDQLKYEIKNFNRLMKNSSIIPRVLDHTLERDKGNYYFHRFRAVAGELLKETEDIMANMLKERRTIRAKMLHRALVRNKLKTKFEKDQEDAAEQEKEFYYAKKKEFFEDLLIEEFWDWQAEYDEGTREEKYFNSRDIENIAYEAQIQEEFFLKNCRDIDYKYLRNNIVLQSYDQTIEEIHYFLTFNVLKILEKESGIDKDQININFKNITISDEFVSKINYDTHLISKHKKVFNEKENKDEYEEYYEYMNEKLEWETQKKEAIYGFMESNILNEFFEGGEVYTYDQKIEHNVEAAKIARRSVYFHGQRILQTWMKILSKRNKTLKNIRKKSIKKKIEVPLNVAYINNIKWTWEQWLIFSDVEPEDEMLKKNTLILNERMSLWNLKQTPVRMKLPVGLTAKVDEVKDYISVKENYMSFLHHRHIMMLSDISPILKQGLVWEECKVMLEKRFNKNIQDLIIWLFTSEAYNRETFKIKQDYQFVFKNFIENYGVFHKLYFVGMPQYTWDLMRYHEAWMGRDEFPYHQYYQLKQMEYLNHDPAAKKIVRSVDNLYLDKFSPISFVWFFKNQYYHYFLYHVYGFISFSSFIWAIKVLMYNPGEYVSENYILFTPLYLAILFWYLRRRVKEFKELKDSGELYLYRYHSSKRMDNSAKLKRKAYFERRKREWTEHFYDADKIEELFPEGIQSINTNLESDWWKYHTHRNKVSDAYFYHHAIFWSWFLGIHTWTFYWGSYQFKYRNVWWLWDSYRYDEELVKMLREKGLISDDIRAPKTYADRQWYYDSWTRLENGGNIYSRWYENIYRIRQGLPIKKLDYGHDWQVILPEDGFIYIDGKRYNFRGSNGDINWIVFSRFIEAFNALPEEIKDFKKDLKGYVPSQKFSKWDIKNMPTKREKIRALRANITNRRKRAMFRHIFDTDDEDIFYRNLRKENFTKLEELKESLKSWKFFIKEEIKKIYKGDRYIRKDHPRRRWAKLLYWIEDETGFQTLTNVYPRFLLDSWKKTRILIIKDKIRYIKGHKNLIADEEIRTLKYYFDKYLNIFRYIKNQNIKREREILITKSKCYYKGENMDMRAIMSISELELHVANLRFFWLKSKQYRILKKLLQNKKYYISSRAREKAFKIFQILKKRTIEEIQVNDKLYEWAYFDFMKKRIKKNFNRDRKLLEVYHYDFRIKKMKEIELYKVLYLKTAKKLRRYYNYLLDVPKKLNYTERFEYRYNLIVNFWKEKKDLWIFIKDLFYQLSIWDILTFIAKIIWKLFE